MCIKENYLLKLLFFWSSLRYESSGSRAKWILGFMYTLLASHCRSYLYEFRKKSSSFLIFTFFSCRTFRTLYNTGCIKNKVREKSRECHNHKPQPFLDPKRKRKRKPTNPNKHKSNKRTKSTKISSLFPKRGNRNTKRTKKHKNKMTHGKTYNKSPRRINHQSENTKIKLITIINKHEYSWLILLYARVNENQ